MNPPLLLNPASVYDVRFPMARSMIVSGPSCSGKSCFVTRLIKEANHHFFPTPKKILWFYGEIEPKPALPHVSYQRGIPSEEECASFQNYVVVLDDLMWEARSNMQVGNLFTRVAHHRECFIIHITQNLFQGGSITRTQSLNAHYLVLFKNPRDKLQITYLARQVYPRNTDFFLTSYEDATTKHYGYLLLDLGPTTREELRLRTNIFKSDKQYEVYVLPN